MQYVRTYVISHLRLRYARTYVRTYALFHSRAYVARIVSLKCAVRTYVRTYCSTQVCKCARTYCFTQVRTYCFLAYVRTYSRAYVRSTYCFTQVRTYCFTQVLSILLRKLVHTLSPLQLKATALPDQMPLSWRSYVRTYCFTEVRTNVRTHQNLQVIRDLSGTKYVLFRFRTYVITYVPLHSRTYVRACLLAYAPSELSRALRGRHIDPRRHRTYIHSLTYVRTCRFTYVRTYGRARTYVRTYVRGGGAPARAWELFEEARRARRAIAHVAIRCLRDKHR